MINNIIRQIKLIPESIEGLCYFGYSVAVCANGKRIAIGAPMQNSAKGNVYIFVNEKDNWIIEEILTNGVSTPNTFFGKSLSMNDAGDRLVVGSICSDTNKPVVYIFKRINESNWCLQKRASVFYENAQDVSVSISGSGNTIATGVNSTNYKNDYIYILNYIDNKWVRSFSIRNPNVSLYQNFGSKVKISNLGDIVLIRASHSKYCLDVVFVYIFKNNDWVMSGVLKNIDSETFEQFGSSLDISADNNKILIGAELSSSKETMHGTACKTGAVYLYTLENKTYKENFKFQPADSYNGDRFGSSVAINDEGNLIAVGALNKNAGKGCIYVYKLENDKWINCGYLTAEDAMQRSYLGSSLAMSLNGGILVSGAIMHTVLKKMAGAAYIFN